MKNINIKIISALALLTSLSTGVITAHAAEISNNKTVTITQQTFAANTAQALNSESVLLPKNKEAAVKLWAEALMKRNGAFRYAILTNDLKNQEYEKYSEMNWVIGVSSPWVVSYKISEKNKIDAKTSEYEIDYIMTDSSKDSYNAHETLTVTQLGQSCFVTKHDNYDYIPDNIISNTGSKFSKVQTRSLKSNLLPRDKENTVNLWAQALKERNGAFRYAILTNDLKNEEYQKYSEMNWVIGGSSPKVVSYKINEKNKVDDKTSEYEINYTLTDSTKALYYAKENITVVQLGQNCFITKHDNYEYLPEVTK